MISFLRCPPNPYAIGRTAKWPSQDMYCPHPYTNWGLNPNYQVRGVRLHTEEGFKKTTPHETVESMLDEAGTVPRIYCLGQSTTYCTNLPHLGQAWPEKIVQTLRFRHAIETTVINGAVGGHTTYQSLIRYMAWGTVYRPSLTIVYTSKNDLTPLLNSALDQPYAYPDHQNIVLQFGWAIARRLGCRGRNIGNAFERDEKLSASDPLGRFDTRQMQLTLSRYDAIARLSAQWGGRVLFIAEAIKDSVYRAPMDAITEGLQGVVAEHGNTAFLDVRARLLADPANFEDKLHLSEAGCDTLAEMIASAILDRSLLGNK